MGSVHYQFETAVMVPNGRGQQPMEVRAVLDSGSEVSCVSEKVAAELGIHFNRAKIVYPQRKSAKDRVAGGRESPIKEQGRSPYVTIPTPQAPIEVKTTLVMGSRSIRERPGVATMASLRDNLVRDSKGRRMSPNEMIKLAAVTKES